MTRSYFSSHGWAYALFVLLVSLFGMGLSPMAWAGEGGIQIRAHTQIYRPFEGTTRFQGNVQLATSDTQVSGPQADFTLDASGKPQQAVFPGRSTMVRNNSGVKQTIQADTMQMGMAAGTLQAQGNVTTKVSGNADLGDVLIHSDSQAFDQQNHTMRATGRVQVQKGAMRATSPEAIIFLGNSGAAEKVVFLKGAQLIQANQNLKAETITIQLTTGDIFAEKNTESTVIGKDTQGHNTTVKVKAHLQELNKASGTLIANGNALVDYEDYIARGPKAVFYRKNEVLDKIVLTGRAEIEDPERKVSGDTVTITVNPKQFNAQGNVTTFIKAKSSGTASKPVTGKTAAKGPVKGANTPKTASVPASPSALDQELMIEDATERP